MSDPTRIDPTLAQTRPVGATQTPAANGPSASPRFQELLERLQKLAAEQRRPDDVETPEQLEDALRTADDGFVAAMDLRRQLEDAFKKHMS